MKRPGTEYAELFAENFAEFRESGDALILCRYIEFDDIQLGGEDLLAITHYEEVDCLLYEVDPKTVDLEKYHEADKVIGFPWCNISLNPIINAAFEEVESGLRWIITGILADDPLKAFTQCACTRLYENKKFAVLGSCSVAAGADINARGYAEEDMFWSRSTTTATAYALTDGYTEVPSSQFGPVVETLTALADQRARFVYSSSIQTLATGVSGGQIDFKLQRSIEDDGQPYVWSDLPGATAVFSLAIDQDDRITFSFTDTIPSGIPSGKALVYRLLAKRSDSDHGVTLHSGDIQPTISIDGQFNYPEAEDGQGYATVASTATVSTSGIVAEDGAANISAGLAASATGYVAEEGSASVQPSVNVSVGGEAAGSEGTVTVPADASVSASGEAASQGAATVNSNVSSTAAGESVGAEGAANVQSTITVSVSSYVPEDVIWTAPPSSPAADELGLTFEEVLGTTVTIPGYAAGLPNVRFQYKASISLLATGASGGLCTFQLQKSYDGGAWSDVTGQTATKEFTTQDQEERFTFALEDGYPAGIPANTPVQYRLVGKTDTAGREVEVHSSLIDPGNTSPSCYVEAEYFFS